VIIGALTNTIGRHRGLQKPHVCWTVTSQREVHIEWCPHRTAKSNKIRERRGHRLKKSTTLPQRAIESYLTSVRPPSSSFKYLKCPAMINHGSGWSCSLQDPTQWDFLFDRSFFHYLFQDTHSQIRINCWDKKYTIFILQTFGLSHGFKLLIMETSILASTTYYT